MDERDRENDSGWRKVVGWPEYEISDRGDVYSVRFSRMLKPYVMHTGRLRVKLSRKYRQDEGVMVDHLVAEAFIGPPPETGRVRHQVRHINNDLLDNRPENLEWER